MSVAINEPAGIEGVKTASAGLLFWVHVPKPLPPDQVLLPPDEDAPVIVIEAGPLQLFIEVPALADGRPATLTVTLVQDEVLHVLSHLA